MLLTRAQGVAVHFLNIFLRRLEPATIVSIRDAVVRANLGPHREDIMKMLEERLTAPPKGEVVADVAPSALAPWRERFDHLAQEILHPNRIDWMDDDDGVRYIQRALDGIAHRVKK